MVSAQNSTVDRVSDSSETKNIAESDVNMTQQNITTPDMGLPTESVFTTGQNKQKYPHFDTGGLSMQLSGEPTPLSLGELDLQRNLTMEFWYMAVAFNDAGYSRDFALITASKQTKVNGRFETVNLLEQRNELLAIRGRKGIYYSNIRLGRDPQHIAVVLEPGDDCDAYGLLHDFREDDIYNDPTAMARFGLSFMSNMINYNVHLSKVTIYINGTVGDVVHINEFLIPMEQCRSFRLIRHLASEWFVYEPLEWVFGAMKKEEETLGSYLMPASGYVDNLRIYNVSRTQNEIVNSMYGTEVEWDDIHVNESAWLSDGQLEADIQEWVDGQMFVYLPHLRPIDLRDILLGNPKSWTGEERKRTGLINFFEFNEGPYELAESPQYKDKITNQTTQFHPFSMQSITSPFPVQGKFLYASVIVNALLELDLFDNVEDDEIPTYYLMMEQFSEDRLPREGNLTGTFIIDGEDYSTVPAPIPGPALVKSTVQYYATERRKHPDQLSPMKILQDNPDGEQIEQIGDQVMLIHCFEEDLDDCDFFKSILDNDYLVISIAVEEGPKPKIDTARAIINTNANHYLKIFGGDDVLPTDMTFQLFHKPFEDADGTLLARTINVNGTLQPLTLYFRRNKVIIQVGDYERAQDVQLEASLMREGITPGYLYDASMLTFTTRATADGGIEYEVLHISMQDDRVFIVMSGIVSKSEILAGQGYDGSNLEPLSHSIFVGAMFMADSTGKLNPYKIYYGIIDDIKIWNRVLTYDEILATKNRRETSQSPGLLAYVTFDQFPVGLEHDRINDMVRFPVIYEEGIFVDAVSTANTTTAGVTERATTIETNDHKYNLTPIAEYMNVEEYDRVQHPGISSNPATYICDVTVGGYRSPCMEQLFTDVNSDIEVLFVVIRTLPVHGRLLRRDLTTIHINDTVVLPLSDEGLTVVKGLLYDISLEHDEIVYNLWNTTLMYEAPAETGKDVFTYTVHSATQQSDFDHVVAQIQVLLPSPVLTSAVSQDCKDVDMLTFDQNDCIRLDFNTDVREVKMKTKAIVDEYVSFSCDLGHSDYYGSWNEHSLLIIFKKVDGDVPVPVYDVPCNVTVRNINTNEQMPMKNSTIEMQGNWGVARGIDHKTVIWLGGILGSITIGMFLFVLYFRNHQAIRCTGYAMSLHVILGLLLMCVSLCFQGVYQGNELGQFGVWQCEIFIFLAFSGLYFIIAALCLKNYRLNVLFNWDLKRSLKQQKIVRTLMNDISLTIMIWVGYALFVIYSAVWFVVSPIGTTELGSCYTKGNVFFYTALALLAIGLAMISVLSYKTRTVPVQYGEPKAMAITVVCITFGLIIWITTSFLLTADNNLVSTVLAACILWIIVSTLSVLFGSRIYKVIKNKEIQKDDDENGEVIDESITDTVFLKHRRTKLRAELIALQERVLEQQEQLGIEIQLPGSTGVDSTDVNTVPLTSLNADTMWNMLSPGVMTDRRASNRAVLDATDENDSRGSEQDTELRDTLSIPAVHQPRRNSKKKVGEAAKMTSISSESGSEDPALNIQPEVNTSDSTTTALHPEGPD